MLRLLIVAVFLLRSLSGHGQAFAVSSDLLNVAYAGVDNEITVAAEGYSCDQLIVSVKNGSISKKDGCHYMFRPETPGNDSICIKTKTATGLKTLGYVRYRIKSLPSPTATLIGGDPHMVGVKNQLSSGVIARLQNFDLYANFLILDYTIEAFHGVKLLFSIKNTGSLFSAEGKAALDKLKPGSMVVISNIRCLGPDKITRQLNNITHVLH